MKFTIYIKGRAWSFQLAENLYKKNFLKFLVTSYPKFYVKKYGIPSKHVKSFSIIEITQKILQKINYVLIRLFKINLHAFYINFLDKISDYIHSLFLIKDSDFYILGFGNSTCQILKKTKKKKIKTIYFLNNSTDDFFDKTLDEEYRKLGIENIYTLPNLPLRKRIYKSIKEANYIGAISSFQANTFINEGIVKSEKILIAPIGTDTKLFKPIPNKNNKFVVITVANDVVRKGMVYLIDAFNSLSLDNSELWLIGSLNKDLLKKITKLKKNNKIIGPVSEFKLPELYNKSSIFCLPTLEDGGPMVIPQAMACGLPVISSKFSVAPDFITNGEEGFIINPRDKNKIAEKIDFFYKNPKITLQMGIKARNTIEEKGSWEKMTENIIEFCKVNKN